MSRLAIIAQLAGQDGQLSGKAQIVAVIITVLLLGVVLELVRRRRLVERYALLWMVGAVVLLVLAVWPALLDRLSGLVGVESPPNTLFLLALGVIFFLLLHFSVATSRLGEEAKILAQEVARLDHELREERARRNGAPPGPARAPLGGPAAVGDRAQSERARASASKPRTSDQ